MPSRSIDLRAVEARLRKLEAADRFSGVVGVRRGDQELMSGAFGYASRTWDVPMAPGMRFDSASITKVFTAVATLQLVESGAFDLATSAIEYLGLEGTGISAAVTPYHLLTHTSGIADDADEEAGEGTRICSRSVPTTHSLRRSISCRSSSASRPTSLRAPAAGTATSATCCSAL